jgi:hypothetical protein
MLKLLNPASWCKLHVGGADADADADAWDMTQSGTSREKEGDSPRLVMILEIRVGLL